MGKVKRVQSLRNLLAGIVFTFILVFPAPAEPALWVVHGAGSTIYLFGTIHALKPGTVWFTPKISRAFAESRDLWLEVGDLGTPDIKSFIMRLAMDPAHSLSAQLPIGDQARLDRAAKIAGLPGAEALEPMRPWFAAVALAAGPILNAGYDPNSGVDKTLQARAVASGKPVYGFETTEQQLHFLADLPQGEQLDFLHQALDDVDEGAKKLNPMIDAWARGDVAALAALEDEDMRKDSPGLYRKLITERDTAWARRLAKLIKEPGTHFVAVGAAHLAGPDSVQKALTKYGLVAARE